VSEEEKQKFFQFPLALLAYGANWVVRRNAIIAIGTIGAGFGVEARMGGKAAACQRLEGETHPGFKTDRRDHRAWALGHNVVKWSWHDGPEPCVTYYREAQGFLSYFGKSPFVRVDSDLIGELVGGSFEARDFSVLCAVYAILGDKQYAIVRRDRVRAGALGYSSAGALFDRDGRLTPEGEARLKERADGARPLSLDQVRYTLDRLHSRKFFSRIQPVKSGRTVFYSRGLDHENLAGRLIGRLERKLASDAAQTAAEEKFREKTAPLIKAGNVRGKTVPEGQNPPEVPQIVPAGVPGGVPAGVPALIPALPNNCSLNSCPPNSCASMRGARATALEEGKPKRKGKPRTPQEVPHEEWKAQCDEVRKAIDEQTT
jgi:hypothetical protein